MVAKYFHLVKFSHSIFALPFALIGFSLGTIDSSHPPSLRLFFLVVICMVTARNAAMGFNRYLDRDIDAQNIRTQTREIPAGVISPKQALFFIGLNCLLFVLSSYFINKICFVLSPIALILVLGYSYTKRFTALCHLVLGIGLGLAPIGAYLAVTGHFDVKPILLGITVWAWVSGFDIIYALQDEEFDKTNHLYSIPALLGKANGRKVAMLMHFIALVFLCLFIAALWSSGHIGYISILAAAIFSLAIIYQHSIVKIDDLSNINLAFFTSNGVASLIFGAMICFDLFL